MQPNGSITKFLRILDVDGQPVPALDETDLTITAWHKPYGGALATFTHGTTLTEVATNFYALTFTGPTTAGQWGYWAIPTDATYQIEWAQISDETENQDNDSLYNAVARPIIGLTGQGTIGETVPLSMVAHRYRVLRFTFVDSAGVNVDMTSGTTYENFRWSVRDPEDQTEANAKYDQSSNITAGDGWVQVVVLEAASFFSAIAEDDTVEDKKDLRHELVADIVAVSGETIALVPSSVLTLTRREEGTG
jgi:hypothetical protein